MKLNQTKYIYNRNIGLKGCVTVIASPQGTRESFDLNMEMCLISRFIWGLGAAANEIYNAIAAGVKFQSESSINERRAKLLTKIWRYCKKNNIPINCDVFHQQYSGRLRSHKHTENFEELITIIKNNYEKFKSVEH